MPRMIDQIRSSALSANLVQAAARGALVLPPEETIEILVYLANHNSVFGQQARMTLAGWDEKSSIAVAANPKAPLEVLEYMASPENLRPPLLPALLGNPSLPEKALISLAHGGSRDALDAMAQVPRVRSSPTLRTALLESPRLSSNAAAALAGNSPDAELPDTAPVDAAAPSATENPATVAEEQSSAAVAEHSDAIDPADGRAPDEATIESGIAAFMSEHADEIAAEAGRPFQPIGGMSDEAETTKNPPAPQETVSSSSNSAAAPSKAPVTRPGTHAVDQKRGSALQTISRLDVKGRIQLAMKGNKEERSILIRDGTKIVALAVLDSPKITDSEVEGFANQKNVLEAVLRAIPMKRRFAKNYSIVRNLVFNPRSPIDVSLALMKHLLVGDLRNLSGNKQISETVRKMALKMFKQKTETSSKKKD